MLLIFIDTFRINSC